MVSEVARRFDVSTGLIYTWRQQAFVKQAEPAFRPAKLVDSASSDAVELAIAVDFPNGVKVRIGSAAPCDLAAATKGLALLVQRVSAEVHLRPTPSSFAVPV